MKQIWNNLKISLHAVWMIFSKDVHTVFTNIWATIIVLGIMVIPALYAWFNINSNWDPYSSTNGIKIAVANSDSGAEIEGAQLNIGGMIVDKLAQNHAIGWQFVDEQDALEGVSDGSYYAAVVIPKDFSSSVKSIASLVIDKPEILYYVNEKKNAIAPKITNSGINTVQVQVNQAIVETASSVLSTLSVDAVGVAQTQGADAVEQVTDALQKVSDSLQEYQTLMAAMTSSVDALESSLDSAGEAFPNVEDTVDKAASAAKEAQGLLEDSHSAAQMMTGTLDTAIRTGKTMAESISGMAKDTMNLIDPAASTVSGDASASISTLYSQTVRAASLNQEIIHVCQTLENAAGGRLSVLSGLIDKLQTRQDQLETLEDRLSGAQSLIGRGQNLAASQKSEISKLADQLESSTSAVDQVYTDTVKPQVETVYSELDSMLEDLSGMQVDPAVTESLDSSMNSMKDALQSGSNALNLSGELLGNAKAKIDGYITEIEEARENEKLLKVEELLERDPELVAAFMKQPVSIQTVSVYPIANYGSGMAPFYTTLAIWVGALVNCAILKTKVKDRGQVFTPNQEYFGRYLFFAFVSICQALIICLGDLWLMKIQCLHPFLFCFMGVITAISFSLLMYTLTVSFGDVGKAVAVILMVIQVAGSGGTFPIEVLPDFYQKLYPFYPFNYAINGMRECIGGIYQNYYWIDIFKELCFLPISLIIGLVLRKPIIQMKEYIEERIEKTGFIG